MFDILNKAKWYICSSNNCISYYSIRITQEFLFDSIGKISKYVASSYCVHVCTQLLEGWCHVFVKVLPFLQAPISETIFIFLLSNFHFPIKEVEKKSNCYFIT